ncbi:MAG: nuclear transport factor 2 family protein [Novosphingobium sp.]|nr:nuclear transport factor 2 family protein [Novosphingobium sp.]MCB2080666.1 nuclear transport factor 2 family protein [Novosphingobium sp.]
MTVEERLQRLEDDRAIRDLKARYLRACDTKDVEGVNACLVEDAVIRFEGFPDFDNREDFVAVYEQFGCAPGVFDIHHAANGVIAFDNAERASGQWSLTFHNINLANRTLTQFGIEYEDSYVKRDGRWLIAASRSVRKSVLVQAVDADGNARVSEMGQMQGAFGE